MTPRQNQVMNFVARFIAENNFSPSSDEIMVGIGLKSKSGVSGILPRLKEQGYITYIPRRARSIEITPLGLQKVGAGRCPTCGTPYRSENQ